MKNGMYYTCTRTKYKQIWEVILIVRCFVSTLQYMMSFERKFERWNNTHFVKIEGKGTKYMK